MKIDGSDLEEYANVTKENALCIGPFCVRETILTRLQVLKSES